jgi:hypothetical protein
MPFSHPLLPVAKAKKFWELDEVSFGDLLIAFGRTLFEHKTDN